MNVTTNQRAALITYLSRRLPDWDSRAAVARGAGLPEAQYAGDPHTGWTTLIGEALDEERLMELLQAAAKVAPGDAEIAQMAEEAKRGELVVPFNLPDRRLMVAGLAVGAALLVGAAVFLVGGLFAVGGGEPEGATAADPVEAAAESAPPPVEAAPAAEEVVPAANPAVTPPVRSEPTKAAPPAPAKPPEPPPPEVVAPPVAPRVAPADGSSDHLCAQPAGKIAGYAFFAMEKPSFPGDVWELSRDLNVRLSYPSKENGWSAKADVVCILLKGTSLKIIAEPIRVAGGAWWVPVVGGSATPPQ